MSEFTISGYGDLGDEIAAMPIARHLGKASFLLSDNPMCKKITPRINLLKPLMESQSYIKRCDVWYGEPITHDVAPWRDGGVEFGKNLLELHAGWVGLEVDQSPWLTVEPDERFQDKIVINRSTRHRSDYFPWAEVMNHFPVEDMVFIGLPEEHTQHVNEFGVKVLYHPTKDLYECAKIIQASKLFIGNQSSCINIAIGLGKRFCLETSLSSVDCLYNRPDSLYVTDGEMELEVEGYKTLRTKSKIPEREVPWDHSPPGSMWFLTSVDGVEFTDYTAFDLLRKVNQHEFRMGIRMSQKQDIAHEMLRRFPTWGNNSHQNWIYDRVKEIKELINQRNQPVIVNEK